MKCIIFSAREMSSSSYESSSESSSTDPYVDFHDDSVSLTYRKEVKYGTIEKETKRQYMLTVDGKTHDLDFIPRQVYQIKTGVAVIGWFDAMVFLKNDTNVRRHISWDKGDRNHQKIYLTDFNDNILCEIYEDCELKGNHECFRCPGCDECDGCFDCVQCVNCTDCQNCHFCVGLKYKKNHMFNINMYENEVRDNGYCHYCKRKSYLCGHWRRGPVYNPAIKTAVRPSRQSKVDRLLFLYKMERERVKSMINEVVNIEE